MKCIQLFQIIIDVVILPMFFLLKLKIYQCFNITPLIFKLPLKKGHGSLLLLKQACHCSFWFIYCVLHGPYATEILDLIRFFQAQKADFKNELKKFLRPAVWPPAILKVCQANIFSQKSFKFLKSMYLLIITLQTFISFAIFL